MPGLSSAILGDRQLSVMATEASIDEVVARIHVLTDQVLMTERRVAEELNCSLELGRRAWCPSRSLENLREGYLRYSASKYAQRLLVQNGRELTVSVQIPNLEGCLTLCVHYGDYIAFLAGTTQSKAVFIARYAPKDASYSNFLSSLRIRGLSIAYGLDAAIEALSNGLGAIVFVDSCRFDKIQLNVGLDLGGLLVYFAARTSHLVLTASRLGVRLQDSRGNPIEGTEELDYPEEVLYNVTRQILEKSVYSDVANWDRLKFLARLHAGKAWPSVE